MSRVSINAGVLATIDVKLEYKKYCLQSDHPFQEIKVKITT